MQVTGEGDDKYLIATAEQPLCALHRNNWMDTKTLPVKYKSNMHISFNICFEHNVEYFFIEFQVTTLNNFNFYTLAPVLYNSEQGYRALVAEEQLYSAQALLVLL